MKKAVGENKKEQARFLSRITSGKDLLEIVHNPDGNRTNYKQFETEENAEFIDGIVQKLIDYRDISGMAEAYDRVKMGSELNEMLKDIENKGYYLFWRKEIWGYEI